MRDKLCKIFQHPSPEGKNKQYIENMESSNSVGIHIRRGTTYCQITFVVYAR